MKNKKLVKLLKKDVEKLRYKINNSAVELKDENNYDLIFDTLVTEIESDICNLIDTFNTLIDDIDDMDQ
jgi:hypothetical protein